MRGESFDSLCRRLAAANGITPTGLLRGCMSKHPGAHTSMEAVAHCIGVAASMGGSWGTSKGSDSRVGSPPSSAGGRPETAMLDTGWRPQYTFDEALQDYLKWLSEYPSEPCTRGCEPA